VADRCVVRYSRPVGRSSRLHVRGIVPVENRRSSASDRIPCAFNTQHKENAMTIKPPPGNRPDTSDMSGPLEKDGESTNAAPSHASSEDEEEEAARLGDFA
jgi:hypothetical protein